MMNKIIALAALCVFIFTGQSVYAAPLVPPAGYFKSVGHKTEKNFSCPLTPAPYTSILDFASQYENDSAHDRINPTAEVEYKARTAPIEVMEKGTNELIDKYMASGNPRILACAVNWLTSWSGAHALEGKAANRGGEAQRKWTLGSLSGGYLRLKFSASAPLRAYPDQSRQIEAWFGRLADKVKAEWSPDTGYKMNNHYYWAAWGVMATSIVLNRKDLFDWSMSIYDVFTGQMDNEGYLPYELARKTKAFAYHEYSLEPLAMIATFAKANGVDVTSRGNHALSRLGNRVFAGMDNIAVFEARTGVKQNLEGTDSKSGLAWLEPYCSLMTCPDTVLTKLRALRPLKNTRLGGNVTALFYGE